MVPLAPSFDTVGWLARDARMLARCGRALLGGKVGARGFDKLGVLDDAFDLVDERFVGPLREAVKSLQRVFKRRRATCA